MKTKVANDNDPRQEVREQWIAELQASTRSLGSEAAGDTARANLRPKVRQFEYSEMTRCAYFHRDDAIAERYILGRGPDVPDSGAAIPTELRQARDLVYIALRAARVLERDFLEGLPPALDPQDDVAVIRRFVERAYATLREQGLEPGLTGHQRAVFWGDERSCPVRDEYAALPTAGQRRWRRAMMKFLDRCVAEGVTDPWAVEDEAWIESTLHGLPFAIYDFERGALTSLLAAWSTKRAGAKPTESKLIGGKWEMLSKLLHDAWGCRSTAKALESERGRVT